MCGLYHLLVISFADALGCAPGQCGGACKALTPPARSWPPPVGPMGGGGWNARGSARNDAAPREKPSLKFESLAKRA